MQQQQNRITKTCQMKRNKRAERLRDLLQLTPSDSILLDACARKSYNDVKELLQVLPGINPDTIRDKYLRTPLHLACSRRDDPLVATSIAKLLIRAGSDVNNGVGDVDGLQPMHMAVLAGNYQCVLMLLHEGANIPASDPFRLTPLLLAKLKLDNLLQVQHTIHSSVNDGEIEVVEWVSSSAKSEYHDLKLMTQALVNHLANKNMTSFGLPCYDNSNYYGLSDFLFLKERETTVEETELNETISNITDKLATISMNNGVAAADQEQQVMEKTINGLIAKVKKLGIHETVQ